MPIESAYAGRPAGAAFTTFSYRRFLNAVFFVFIASGCIAFVEPSPFDFMALVTIPLWFIGGFRIHRMFFPFFFLLSAYTLGGFISLTHYWNEPDSVSFMITSVYLNFVAFFFALFFAERTIERAELCLKAFTLANIVAAAAGIIGYLDIAGLGADLTLYGRASGTFKDPNVLGGFLVPGAVYCMQLLMLNRTRWRFFTAGALLLLITGILFTFSRGSYGAFVLSAALMVGSAVATTRDAVLRRKILIGAAVVLGLMVLLFAALMSIEEIRLLLLTRTSGEGYEDLRYFNQSRSLSYLIEHPLGYGPLRFRLYFLLEPHSSYVSAFASYGWFGGLSFLLLVGATIFTGFRLCWRASPFRTYAQVLFPPLLAFLLQGFQIDIDHWRHLYILFGAVWGLEAARCRWAAIHHPGSAQAARARPASIPA